MTAPATLDFRNTNTLWCSVLVETLVRCGLTHAIVSPGSRSTPITMALATHPGIEAIPLIDERSASFFALGLAKKIRRPVLLVCTSGTAGANYLPAVIEARESGVPLLVLTADRPPEMRECASGQTIDQQKLYGSHVVWYHELCVPAARLPLLRYLRQTAAHAFERAHAGPVHLNAPFRDPLPPLANDSAQALAGQIDASFFAHLSAPPAVLATFARLRLPPAARGLIVAGPTTPANVTPYVASALNLARELGWPVLADVLSPLRQNASAGEIVTAYDAILRTPENTRRLAPDFVLCLGGWPTSKALREWLTHVDAETLLLSPAADNLDSLHGRTRHLPVSIENVTLEAPAASAPPDPSYRKLWQAAEEAARHVLDSALSGESLGAFEGRAAWRLACSLPADTPVFVANSMPVRDLEYFWPATRRGLHVHYSRGANGIDGTLSTALGLAHGSRPTVLLTGDLALLHDANGFLAVPHFRGSLTIVLIDNHGGGIFGHLPIAQFDPPFEKFWATPQQVDFAALCAAHRVDYIAVNDGAQFQETISTLPAAGVRVLHLRTDRKRDAEIRKKLLAEAGGAAVPA